MALTADYQNLIIHSDASITDMVAFHDALRDIEASDTGMLFPVVHSYKEVQLGGGAIFPALAFINGWTLQFPAGNWEVRGGNLDADINPVAGCYVDRTQAAAYAVTGGAGGGLTTDQAAMLTDLWQRLGLDPANPLTQTSTAIQAGGVDLALTEVGGTVTVERQP